MRKLILLLAFVPLLTFSQQKPKLVVGIVVDQMRFEMLERFQSDFGEGGFNLIMKDGYEFTNCKIEYVPTYTGPGHATIFTGVMPKDHGILSNDIYNPKKKEAYYCVADSSVRALGTDQDLRMSPKNMRVYSFGDSLKLKDPKSKIISVSLKDRGAILSGGKLADASYWIDGQGHFVSSSYFMKELPKWVEKFNSADRVKTFMSGKWELLNDPATYEESLPDNAEFEKTSMGNPSVLPYDLNKYAEKEGGSGIADTPFGNTLITEFVFEAIDEEGLGNDDHTDLLAIIYSATDYIGHDFGPQSVEIQDTYLRLDLELKSLISKLDDEIGRDNYVLFLSSDHGVANTPSDTAFKYVNKNDLKKRINSYTERMYGAPLVEYMGSGQIWLANNVIARDRLDKEEIIVSVKNFLNYHAVVELDQAYTKFEIENCSEGDCLYFKNAFDSKLSGDLFYIRPYGHIERTSDYGSTHSTKHEYDAHVPLVFFGGNVSKGTSDKELGTHDIWNELKMFMK